MKNLTDSKDRHWVIKKDRASGEFKMYLKHKRDVVMEFTIPDVFLKDLENKGYILINETTK